MSLDRLGRRLRRFSVAFKSEILRQLDNGERDIAEVCKIYDLNYSTVLQWVNKAQLKNLELWRTRVELPEEVSRIKQLEEENKKLKQILVNKELDILYYKSMFEAGQDILDDSKKKSKNGLVYKKR
jgi:transposase-like protein